MRAFSFKHMKKFGTDQSNNFRVKIYQDMVLSKALSECSERMITCKKPIQIMQCRKDFHRCIKKNQCTKGLTRGSVQKERKSIRLAMDYQRFRQ
jgi:hypothetical protein